MPDKNDWRLLNQETYLKNAKLLKLPYVKHSDEWDHDHCAFCFDKFSKNENDLHEGHCTDDKKHWICPECFWDFKELFGFEVLKQGQMTNSCYKRRHL